MKQISFISVSFMVSPSACMTANFERELPLPIIPVNIFAHMHSYTSGPGFQRVTPSKISLLVVRKTDHAYFLIYQADSASLSPFENPFSAAGQPWFLETALTTAVRLLDGNARK